MTTAQYLLRFDDLCPTMDGERWRRFRPLLAKFKIRPILAVVPDNRDPELEIDPAEPGFWDEMRHLQGAGATIGLHGYRHLCAAEGRGLVQLHRRTEFAGISSQVQREWIRDGAGILRARGLEPRIWVAPRHGFDAATLGVLREARIGLVSDGFAERPFASKGLTWIPQQLWSPVVKQSGLWTICIHPNFTSDELVRNLGEFLSRFSGQFTSVDRVVREWPPRRRSVSDWVFHARTMGRIRLSRVRNGVRAN